MLTNLLVEARYISIPEALLDGVIGFAVVFLGILVLIAAVWVVGFIVRKFTDRPKKTKKTEVKETQPAEIDAAEDDGELVAVITAAIAAVYKKEGRTCEFVVKKIKRIKETN